MPPTTLASATSISARGRRPRSGRSGWRLPAALIALSLVPAVAGAARLGELAGNPTETAENARFVQAPVPVVVHIVAAIVFSFLGALQFAPTLRRRGARWHRRAGVLVAVAGLVSAASGAWMTHAYELPAADSDLLGAFRDLFAAAMIASILLGVRAARQGRFRIHGAWMMRAYAIGLGAGTQVLTHLPWFALVGETTAGPRTVLMVAGWAINLAVAERAIRHRRRRRREAVAAP